MINKLIGDFLTFVRNTPQFTPKHIHILHFQQGFLIVTWERCSIDLIIPSLLAVYYTPLKSLHTRYNKKINGLKSCTILFYYMICWYYNIIVYTRTVLWFRSSFQTIQYKNIMFLQLSCSRIYSVPIERYPRNIIIK